LYGLHKGSFFSLQAIDTVANETPIVAATEEAHPKAVAVAVTGGSESSVGHLAVPRTSHASMAPRRTA